MLAAINFEGTLNYIVIDGSCKSKDFVGFICELIKNRNLINNLEETYFFCDNASIHKSNFLQHQFFNKVNIMYNCPYSPELNPIEEIFNKWKHLIRSSNP